MPIFPVRSVADATPRARLLTLDLAGRPFPFVAGQAVLVGLESSPARKPYSIASSPQQAARDAAFQLLVQIDDRSAPDPHLELAVPGTRLNVDGPFGSFTLPPALAERDLLLIAGGTGIAPLRAILWDVLERRAADRVAVIYSARREAELAFRDELRRLADAGRIHLRLTTTRDAGPAAADPRPVHRGRIDADTIRTLLRTTATRCLVCGPPPLVADATALLRELDVAAELILTESDA